MKKTSLAEFADPHFATRPTQREIVQSGFYSHRGEIVDDTRSDVQRLRELKESVPPSSCRRCDNPAEAVRRKVIGLYSRLSE